MYIINEENHDPDQNTNNVRKLAAIVFRNLVLKNIQVSILPSQYRFVLVRRQYRYFEQPMAAECRWDQRSHQGSSPQLSRRGVCPENSWHGLHEGHLLMHLKYCCCWATTWALVRVHLDHGVPGQPKRKSIFQICGNLQFRSCHGNPGALRFLEEWSWNYLVDDDHQHGYRWPRPRAAPPRACIPGHQAHGSHHRALLRWRESPDRIYDWYFQPPEHLGSQEHPSVQAIIGRPDRYH